MIRGRGWGGRGRDSVGVSLLRVDRRRGGLVSPHGCGLRRVTIALSRHFGLLGRNLTDGLRRVGNPGVLDDVTRRVGVLAKRAATAPSWVGVVCHDAPDYQSATIAEVREIH